jgi:hypothetical protein
MSSVIPSTPQIFDIQSVLRVAGAGAVVADAGEDHDPSG